MAESGAERVGATNRPQLDWLAGWRIGQDENLHLVDSHVYNMLGSVVPEEPVTVPAALTALLTLVARHESLRTAIHYEGTGRGHQSVHVSHSRPGAIEGYVTVVAEARAREVFDTVRRTAFRPADGFPLRAVLVTRGSRVTEVGLVADHLAIDDWGLRVLRAELDLLLAAAESGVRPGAVGAADGILGADVPAQPLDITAWEESEAGVRRLERALAYWERQFTILHDLMGNGSANSPVRPAGRVPDPVFPTCSLVSERMATAATAVAETLDTSVSAVLLAAFGSALGEISRSAAVRVEAHVLNRRSPAQRSAAVNLFMRAPIVVHGFDGSGPGLFEVVRDCSRQQLRGHALAHVDRLHVEELRNRILPPALSPVVGNAWFNYQSTQVAGDMSRSTRLLAPMNDVADLPRDIVLPGESRRRGRPLVLRVLHMPGSVTLRLMWERNVLTDPQAEELLRTTATLVTSLHDAVG
ncbi:condensation domain-containing protein [Streptomyces sp. NPDC005408]|uniref:condensation domain-containing protein n=1 Tax=Streptomyces sp. NPDC005408 TaxID=3155341 RepID=UPI0033A6F4B9